MPLKQMEPFGHQVMIPTKTNVMPDLDVYDGTWCFVVLQTTTRCGHSPNHILISETSRLQVKVPPKLRGAATLWVGCSEFVEHGAFGYGPFLSIPTLWSCTWMRCVHHHHDCVLSQWPAAGMFASTPNLGASEGRVEVLEVLKAPSYLVLGMLGPSPSHLASVVPGCQERVDRMSSDLRWWQCSKVHHSGYTTRLHNLCHYCNFRFELLLSV